MAPNDIHKIFCLRNTWHYVLDHINDPINLGYVEEIHAQVARADVSYQMLGQLRVSDILISGTSWRPELPDPERLHKELQKIFKFHA